MISSAADLDEIRELEAKLEESLLSVDYAEKRGEPTFGPAAIVAEIQSRLDQLRGPVPAHSERRAAWLAHLAKSEECQTIHDGPAADVTPPVRRPTLPRRPTAGAIEFPQIN